MHQWHTPKSTGEYLGKVGRVFQGGFETEAVVNTGDGLCLTLPDGTFSGFAVNRVEGKRVYREGTSPEPGMDLYRNFDRLFDKMLKGKTAERRMDLDIDLSAPDGRCSLTLRREALPGEQPDMVTVWMDTPLREALDPVQEGILAATAPGWETPRTGRPGLLFSLQTSPGLSLLLPWRGQNGKPWTGWINWSGAMPAEIATR